MKINDRRSGHQVLHVQSMATSAISLMISASLWPHAMQGRRALAAAGIVGLCVAFLLEADRRRAGLGRCVLMASVLIAPLWWGGILMAFSAFIVLSLTALDRARLRSARGAI